MREYLKNQLEFPAHLGTRTEILLWELKNLRLMVELLRSENNQLKDEIEALKKDTDDGR